MQLPDSQAIEVSMPFWALKGVVVWGVKGEEDNSQEDGKIKCLVNFFYAIQISPSDVKSYFWW